MTTQTDSKELMDILRELRTLVNNLLVVLSPKEKQIVEQRFSLNNNPKFTLEKIGKDFGVTRERIRQIEKNALRKLQRNVVNTKLHIVNQAGNYVLQKFDGVLLEDKLVNEILQLVKDSQGIDTNSVKLSLQLDQNMEKVHNTIYYRPYWKFKIIPRNDVVNICEEAISFLQSHSDVVAHDELLAHLHKKLGKKLSKQFAVSCFELDRRIKVVKHGAGLASWRHINPRTLRDKILFVLRSSSKPLHFVDISNKITEAHFDHKTVNTQAIHNELIRYPQFVLIGRGIYALKEWGYEDGTVSDVISGILREHGSLDRDRIVEEVMKRRQVKRIT
ncbi:MAG: sigma factor-like helix-turn-helix DNA-binding protein, partial [Patescibacteria group bacterium]